MIGCARAQQDITTPRGAVVMLLVANLSEEVGVSKVSEIKTARKKAMRRS